MPCPLLRGVWCAGICPVSASMLFVPYLGVNVIGTFTAASGFLPAHDEPRNCGFVCSSFWSRMFLCVPPPLSQQAINALWVLLPASWHGMALSMHVPHPLGVAQRSVSATRPHAVTNSISPSFYQLVSQPIMLLILDLLLFSQQALPLLQSVILLQPQVCPFVFCFQVSIPKIMALSLHTAIIPCGILWGVGFHMRILTSPFFSSKMPMRHKLLSRYCTSSASRRGKLLHS